MTYVIELKQHYVYFIVHKHTGARYIGARTDNHNQKPDILTGKYITSSTDLSFIAEMKEHPENFYKCVLRFFPTRQEADTFESYLHHKYNVDISPKFYNRMKSGENLSFPLVHKGEGNHSNKRVAAYYDNILICFFCSTLEAQRQTKINNISSCAAGALKFTGWYNTDTETFAAKVTGKDRKEFKRVKWIYVDQEGNPCIYPPKEKKVKKKNPNNRRKIAAYQEDGTLIAIFVYSYEAARYTGIADPNISSSALGKTKHSGVFDKEKQIFLNLGKNQPLPPHYTRVYWRYLDENEIPMEPPYNIWKNEKQDKIVQAYIGDVVVATFPSVKEAFRQTNIRDSHICACANGKMEYIGVYNLKTQQFVSLGRSKILPPDCYRVKWRYL